MHAGVVLKHYLVAMNNDTAVPMLDMAEYLKKYATSTSLFKYVWNNEGGDSLAFFRSILKKKPNRKNIILCFSWDDLDSMDNLLQSFGPALVSGFGVTKRFTSKHRQHLGKYEVEAFEGKHAMVLVGYRRTRNGEKRYLLQNWWKTKPYVEVDANYLQSSQAYVYFIKEPHMEMGDYPTNLQSMVECDLDACERFIPEG
jgi:hypothetical protein